MSALDQVSKGVRKGTIIHEAGEFAVQFDYGFIRAYKHEFDVYLELVRKLPGSERKWDDRKFCWRLKPTVSVVDLLAKFTGWGISASSQALAEMSAIRKAHAAEQAALSADEDKAIELEIVGQPALTTALMNYQRAGILFMARKERAYLGDDPGLGKSLQLLATIEYVRGYPAVIMCPPKLKQNWLAECKKWIPHRRASGIPAHLAEITILAYTEAHKFVNYGLASSKKKEKEAAMKAGEGKTFFFPNIARPMTVACDEGHFIKSADAKRSLCAQAIAMTSGSRWRYVMSGTPIENRPAELIAPLRFLNRLDDMGGWHFFASRYCGLKRTRFGLDMSGATNGTELHEKLKSLCYIRRRKTDVLKQLPPKIESVVEVEISNEKEYKRAERDIETFLIEKQAEMLTENQMAALAMMKLGTLRQLVGVGKVEAVVEWIDTFLESGEKFVVYAHHREVLAQLCSGLKAWNPAMVLGGCEDTQAQVNKFMTERTCRVFIGSAKAAGFGITLTAASHIGVVDFMWTPSAHQQIFDRVHRIGQAECVNCYYFSAPGTVDDDMWSILSEKASIIASTVDGEEISKERVMARVIRRFLNQKREQTRTE